MPGRSLPDEGMHPDYTAANSSGSRRLTRIRMLWVEVDRFHLNVSPFVGAVPSSPGGL
jgi:hypothetical protein